MIDNERLVTTLLRLIQIDSPSGQEAQIRRHLSVRLSELGLQVETNGIGNILARMDGKGDASYLLSAHMDNVQPCEHVKPSLRDGIVHGDGTTVLGADDKAGLAVILEVLQTIVEQELPHPPLEVVITAQEELGLKGAKSFDMSKLRSRQGVGLDASGVAGTIVVSAPYQDSLRALVHGKAAHAGVSPEKGINAILVAAEAIATMPLGRIDEETTANIGLIKGGRATNIVPDLVELSLSSTV